MNKHYLTLCTLLWWNLSIGKRTLSMIALALYIGSNNLLLLSLLTINCKVCCKYCFNRCWKLLKIFAQHFATESRFIRPATNAPQRNAVPNEVRQSEETLMPHVAWRRHVRSSGGATWEPLVARKNVLLYAKLREAPTFERLISLVIWARCFL